MVAPSVFFAPVVGGEAAYNWRKSRILEVCDPPYLRLAAAGKKCSIDVRNNATA
jgi:hypothetical protein